MAKSCRFEKSGISNGIQSDTLGAERSCTEGNKIFGEVWGKHFSKMDRKCLKMKLFFFPVKATYR